MATEEEEEKTEVTRDRRKPVALFMAFGTKGDIFPVAALAAAFACDQRQYVVSFMTHSAHRSLSRHLAAKDVTFVSISSPPVLAAHQLDQISDPEAGSIDSESERNSFSSQKRMIEAEQRRECLAATERVFGNDSSEGDFIAINFFALEGWHLAELFQVCCIVTAPYVVPYSAPSSFEYQFKKDLPLLYKYFQEAPVGMVGWKDVLHWMWPLFMEVWGTWRDDVLNLSSIPFTDPVTNLPMGHIRMASPLLLYGFSKEIVECPGYWPPNVYTCGFWFLPMEWQFSCDRCMQAFSNNSNIPLALENLCPSHAGLQYFLNRPSNSSSLIFVGLSSIGSMGFLTNPSAFLAVLQRVIEATEYRFLLFTSGYEPLDASIRHLAYDATGNSPPILGATDSTLLFSDRLFCFSGENYPFAIGQNLLVRMRNLGPWWDYFTMKTTNIFWFLAIFRDVYYRNMLHITIPLCTFLVVFSSVPYSWIFPRCAVAIHHAGSGSTAAALRAGIPQVVCPFLMDQFYWAERLCWIGAAPDPLPQHLLCPDSLDDAGISAACDALQAAINRATSHEIRLQAACIAKKISSEDGIAVALEILREKVVPH